MYITIDFPATRPLHILSHYSIKGGAHIVPLPSLPIDDCVTVTVVLLGETGRQAGCFVALDSWGCRSQGRDRPRVSRCAALHESSTVNATFKTPCELLGGYQDRKPEGDVQKLEVLTHFEIV